VPCESCSHHLRKKGLKLDLGDHLIEERDKKDSVLYEPLNRDVGFFVGTLVNKSIVSCALSFSFVFAFPLLKLILALFIIRALSLILLLVFIPHLSLW
jgi:hypothetical protein